VHVQVHITHTNFTLPIIHDLAHSYTKQRNTVKQVNVFDRIQK